MKSKVLIICVAIIIAIVSVSCLSEKKGDYLPPIKVEIPEALQSNTDAVTFINQSSEVLNQWSVTFEDLGVECEPFVGKEESELSTMDKLKLGKIMMEFMANMGQFAVKVAEMEQTASMIEDGLNEQEIEAMEVVMDSFDARIEELNDKYQDFGKEEEE
jgi:uncharacterized protein YsxB (DUF464 family)